MERKRTMALFRNSFEGEAKEIHKIKKATEREEACFELTKQKQSFR